MGQINPTIKAAVRATGELVDVYYIFNGSSIHSGKYANLNDPNVIYTKEELIIKK